MQTQQKLHDAEIDVRSAIKVVEREQNRPIVIEPSALEELERVKHMIRVERPKERNRGVFVEIKDAVFGQSNGDRAQDLADHMAHEAYVSKLEKEALDKARAQRDYQRGLAQKALDEAIGREDQMRESLKIAWKALSDSKFQLLQAEENLSRTKLDLQRLGEKVIELRDIMTILENSSHHLGALKDQIEPLLIFFKDHLEQGIGHTAENDVKAFLRPIQNRLKENSNSPNDVEAFRLSKKSKNKMLSAALIMQGRFSAIGDISDAYIDVSNTYIRPAISWMERLSTMPVRDWEAEKNKFLTWCKDSVGKIDELAQRTNQNVDEHIKGSILALRQRAMEAREDDED